MLTLVIGGSGSGKSSFGEKLAQESNSKLYYLATMIPYGDEGKRRVERHLKNIWILEVLIYIINPVFY